MKPLRRMIGSFAAAIALMPALVGAVETTPMQSQLCGAHAEFSLVLHGGSLTEVVNKDAELSLARRILADGRERLKRGEHALDVVESTVQQLEDSGILNAGKFANANAEKFVETDAAIMDGRTRAAGAVASMRHAKNPIHAARLVMERSPHVLMVGDRGEAYAAKLGAELVPDDYFINNEKVVGSRDNSEKVSGTVGAAAMDRCGDLAAGTSTGGFGAKIPGRVGDSPIIGAGTYAENKIAAISATGHGEFFIRFSVAANIAARVKYLKQSLDASIHQALQELDTVDAEGGLIGIDATGNVVMRFNRDGMIRGYTTQKELPTALAYR